MNLRSFRAVDWFLIICPIFLALIGLATIYSLGFVNPQTKSFFYDQLLYFGIGAGVAVFLAFYDYQSIKTMVPYIFVAAIILLLLVFFFGKTTFGATRWINLGFFQLQPSEIFKFVLILTLAKIFSDWHEFDLRRILFVSFLIVLSIFLVLIQPDFGTGMVLIFAIVAILLVSQIKKIYLLGIGILFLASTPVLWNFLKDYQKQRIYTFFNPAVDPYGSGYNVLQSIIAVGSGGLFGKGLGQGSQSQLNFIPAAHTDFIFAGWAEATGFVGSLLLLVIFAVLIWQILNVAKVSKDDFGFYFAIGAAGIMLFQVLVNIGMNMGVMPVTGIPLPFVSYSGTALIMNFACIGVLQSIYIRHKKINF